MRAFFVTPLVIFLLVIIVMLAKLIGGDSEKQADYLVRQALPEINLAVAADGVPGINSSELKGKYVLLNIFGSWCITCKIEHPFLMKLKENKTIEIYGINWRDRKENLELLLKKEGNPYTAIGNDFEGKTVVDLGITGAPENLLVSPEGIVLVRYAGALNEDIWNSKFAPLIKEEK